MASSFPASIDSFTDPLSNSALNSPSHSAQHADLNSAANKIETYMGLVKVIPTGATNGTVGATGTVTIGSAVSSVTVAGAFSSLYNNYRIIVNGGTATATFDFNLRIGTSITGYYLTSLYNAFDNGTAQGLQLSNQDSWRYFGAGTSDSLQADIEVMQPNLAKKTMATSRMISATSTGLSMFSQGWLNNTTQHTQFVLYPSSGTWTGGNITVYGYRI